MPGKTDHASQEASIARLAEIVPHAPAILRHLEAVLASRAFCSSRRSQEFLRFVVENALHGHCERLKERVLGMDLFGRDAAYNTGDDSIVRVTATDVRRRLLQYYLQPEHDSGFKIELPSGSYLPEIHRAPTGGGPAAPDAMTAPKAASPEMDTQRAVLRAVSQRPGSSLRLAVAGIAVLAGGFGVGWLSSPGRLPAPLASAARAPSNENQFYADMLGPIVDDSHLETRIVLSNPRLLLYSGSDRPDAARWPTQSDVRVPPSLERALNPSANDEQANFPYHFLGLTTDDYTGMGEALSAFRLGHLLWTLGRPANITQARFLNWEAARKENLVLLGAPHMSAWVRDSLSGSNFYMDHDRILNTHPLDGEPSWYERSSQESMLRDYGLIWMTQSPAGSRLLLLAGLTSTGTAGVGDFFSDPQRMRPVYDRLKAATKGKPIPAAWQVLLKIDGRQNVPLDISYVSMRVGGAAR